MAQAQTRLMAVAMNIASQNVAPVFFKSWDETGTVPMWAACRASSAAQTYFPAFTWGDCVFWDGGIVANNPAMCALAAAVRLWGWDEKIKVLSLGCGVTDSRFDAAKLINAGLVHVGAATLQVMLEGPSDAVEYQLSQMLDHDFLSIQPDLIQPVAMDATSVEAIGILQASAAAAIAQSTAVLDEVAGW